MPNDNELSKKLPPGIMVTGIPPALDDMESILYLLLLVGIWVVLVKVVFPKIGIHG